MPAPASKNSPSPSSHSAPKVTLLKSSTSNSSGSQADVLSMQRFAFSTSPSTRESAPRSAKYPMLKLTASSCAEAGTAAASAAVSPRPVTIDRHMGVLLVINGACGPVPPPNPAVGPNACQCEEHGRCHCPVEKLQHYARVWLSFVAGGGQSVRFRARSAVYRAI